LLLLQRINDEGGFAKTLRQHRLFVGRARKVTHQRIDGALQDIGRRQPVDAFGAGAA
jgi:hypothetical protein